MQNEKKYFASANTDKGFVSYFDDIFGKMDMVYIIKGGPGTGKSSFIRRLSDEAEKRGHNVEYFYCSSDPLSLDGIIVEELKTAIIDGTSPHTYDPKIVGIKEQIINVSANIDRLSLSKNSKEICHLSEEKRALYNNVYNYLAAAGRIESEIRLCNKKYIKREKMEMAVKRLCKGWKRGTGFEKKIRLVDGISHIGHIVYSTYHTMAENKYVIRDRYGIGSVFLEYIMNCAFEKGLKVVYSPRVLETSENIAIYLPEVSTSFVIQDEYSVDMRVINMDRFIDLEKIKENKQKNRFARRCLNSLYEGVQKGFDEIYELHTSLEKYYIESMDFSKNEEMMLAVKREMFL